MEFLQSKIGQFVGLFVAGGSGVCLRAVLIRTLDHPLSQHFPGIGLLIVNLVGCLTIGLCAALLSKEPWRSVLLVGFLGGFTTYSSFALLLGELGTSLRWFSFFAQLILHLCGGVLCAMLGQTLGQWILQSLNSTS